jgi:hypothetical protein
MDELISKLVDLTYEVIGVLVPGFIASTLLLAWWIAAGPVVLALINVSTSWVQPENIWEIFLSPSGEPAHLLESLFAWYFLGQLLLSASRHAAPDAESQSKPWRRVLRALTFRISRPSANFTPELEELYNAVAIKFSSSGIRLEWPQFYPVVKSYLSEHLSYSLVTLYQNKYTLHRSITMAGVILFWLSVLACILAAIAHSCGIAANWPLLVGLALGSFFLVWSFSASFMLHWQLFGNSVVTESYSLLYGPPIDEPKSAQSIRS